MASHGVVRRGDGPPQSEADRNREVAKIEQYKKLTEEVNDKIRVHDFGDATLQLTSKLLLRNPEYYTIWNHRRRILQHMFRGIQANEAIDNQKDDEKTVQVSHIISDDLNFLIPLLQEFPKCYWIWNYRLWLLEQATAILPVASARQFWEQELRLVGKMLTRDSRNFHGWGYRQTVIEMLESAALQLEGTPQGLTEQEFEYTTKMVNTQLSNFSAWHRRSRLIPRLLEERKADKDARKKMLDDELELIERALWGGGEKDSSLWFYHQYLMSNFDRAVTNGLIVPNLSDLERQTYLSAELDKIMDMLDGAEDCKWIYQALIRLCMMYRKVTGKLPSQADNLQDWTQALIEIDPLRRRRWEDQLSVLK